MEDSALYVHIPFCDHKCIYCDFYSIITSDNIPSFLNSIKNEIKFYSAKYSEGRIFTSIFFGGGTPSLMQPKYIGEIISSLKNNFTVSNDAEITMETNPGTVDKKKLESFYKVGINRISIGIQSFHEDELKFLTRIHNRETAVQTVYDANKVGFENINIDLIFNLPKQTKGKWKQNLETAVNLPLKHISAYSLILERGTILNKMVLDGKVILQDDDYDAELYEMTIDFLTSSGFAQYEVSNFTRPGFECRHNNAYWRYKEYLSFGPSAHSFVEDKRWWNFSSLKQYIVKIEKNNLAQANFEIISDEQKFNEYVMLALRSKGIEIKDFQRRFGASWLYRNKNIFQSLVDEKFVEIKNDFICFTKSGYAICDEILSKIL
ncbi:MAG: radical SAM family heme chaperone HemW [Ignavibacteriaceae bacterium]